MLRTTKATIAACVLSCLTMFGTACNRITAEDLEKNGTALVQRLDLGSINWHVQPNGKVHASLTAADGKPITASVTGQLLWKDQDGPKNSPIEFDEKSGLFNAKGPELEEDVTELRYTFLVDGKPWAGALHLPRGGTEELSLAAKKSGTLTVNTNKGPHDGIVQVVGEERVEVVVEKDTREVRVYVLGIDQKPVALGDRQVKLAIEGKAPEVIQLRAEPGKDYFVGTLTSVEAPQSVTVFVVRDGKTHVAIIGGTSTPAGVHVVVNARSPLVNVWVAQRPRANINVHVHEHDRPSKVKVHINEHHGKGKDKTKVQVKVH